MNLDAVLAVAAGVAIVGYALQTAIGAFLLPQPGLSLISQAVFLSLRPFFGAIERLPASSRRRHAWLGIYAPVSLALIVFATMVVISAGYALIFFGIGAPTWESAVLVSISSVSTLGFAPLGDGLAVPIVAAIETITGILVVALLIGYLPSIYGAVRERERGVAALEARVGSPPSGPAILLRYAQAPGVERLDDLWPDWTAWFLALGHSHDTMAVLVFVRSPQPGRSWLRTAAAVLDATALTASALDRRFAPAALDCIDAGSAALAQIVDDAPLLPDPGAGRWREATTLTRAMFDAACADLAAAGYPLAADRSAAWALFVERRNRYATRLLVLSRAMHAPLTGWPSAHHATRPAEEPTGRRTASADGGSGVGRNAGRHDDAPRSDAPADAAGLVTPIGRTNEAEVTWS